MLSRYKIYCISTTFPIDYTITQNFNRFRHVKLVTQLNPINYGRISNKFQLAKYAYLSRLVDQIKLIRSNLSYNSPP